MIGEDALDQYMVKRIEAHTYNRTVRRLACAGLNPARSLANLMEGSYPWHRETRTGVSRYDPKMEKWLVASGLVQPVSSPPVTEILNVSGPAPFELTLSFHPQRFSGAGSSTPCVGGGATAAVRISSSWQLVADVGGCKILDLGKCLTGDPLTHMMGPRWVNRSAGPLTSYVQILIGGNKMTEEHMFPKEKKLLTQIAIQKNFPHSRPIYGTDGHQRFHAIHRRWPSIQAEPGIRHSPG